MDIIVLGTALVIAYFWGSHVERLHFRSIEERERSFPPIPVISTCNRETMPQDVASVKMISGSVVIGADYFKTTLASLVNFFGGNIATIESVLDRARREAVLRAKYQALDADMITNLRYETTELGGTKKSMLKVEVYAYATAIYMNKNALQTHAF